MAMNHNAVNKVSGIELFLFPFEDCDASSLESIGSKIIPPSLPKRVGKSSSRMRSYWAGRAAVAVAFKRLGIQGFIRPEPNYGYLQVVEASGEIISDLYVNLSHTENIVAVVLSPCPVGVDIELASRDASRVMSRVASEFERNLANQGVYATNGKSLDPNIALWSAKEAAAKAVGLGMKFGLNCFEIQFKKDDVYRVKSTKSGPLKLKSPTLVIESFDPYIISVCSELEVMPSGRIGRSLVSSFDLN
ncbi:MAG: 4'-phosphopantetheinyl transferase superfamily protein [Proteobacteria bacterium]|nr:4'-phosphopantetheinyl transferase superfamily protein [Pseudomonadota bacterium]